MPITEQVIQILNSNATGNLVLLLAAVVGVVGNYGLYLRKRNNRAKTLRRSLYSEITSMRPVVQAMHREKDAISMDPLDPRSFLIDSVYQASSDELGLLTESEVSAVVDFYSTAISIQRIIGDNFHTAYDQVDRRDLLFKLDEAQYQLKQHIDFTSRSEFNQQLEPEKVRQ
ncbi:hypothetical protein ACFQJC_02360 [Haloferax namakaokahaiae]|uniref:DUF4760 domain-containing protein n=1 Tax=Haloferax namakaokahaiae TaxID=1748331 RepID=A0ABD5ZAR3_9EURY